ncbi:class I SAM-dependent methyltransferase [Tuwongella immobilis]|uniref:THUMP-like domain-containing protein n=1 Tax=Tuwongella immobilis TaxID=692036 RepID=A0A6C2YIY8_9BACT|nr:class I SAM-dependent methyltransferase [Tuwongella immobilis]VIP01209.1 Uncharacterized protein OS=Chloroflexus aurantiacus (strain ATCC 29364 / DSM 637 / Y-400-fl) GN=Chy400_1560 PE=4 SV=1 [Tuwongella immobilis]VTR97844.1 Uncharacterized protein OS=Chloroflexus aurantiacus (strain ATCC 29364 / DSM 637 / Y-400-fl) GN=Chy400_1560 PE=4 SV=1 [Tuwongella immobilis]
MDLASWELLRSSAGQTALRMAMQQIPTDATFLAELQRLSRAVDADTARLALQQAMLRQRAREKFQRADQMLFQREALEQATSEPIARYRAGRFAGMQLVAEVGCGIGGDSLALAQVAPLWAIDRDPVRLAMAEYNVQVNEPKFPVRFDSQELKSHDWRGVDGIFVDPARRVQGQRILRVEDAEPPLSQIRQWQMQVPAVAVKLAPGTARLDWEHQPAEVEFISRGGELKECVLWFGPWRSVARRATVLDREGRFLGSLATPFRIGALPDPVEPRGYLLDPDAAVIRAELLGDLAESLHAAPLEEGIALLTCDEAISTPFAECLEIEAIVPVKEKPLKAELRRRKIGSLEIRKRGVSMDADALARAVRLPTGDRRILLVTPLHGKPTGLLLRRLPESTPTRD